VPPGFVLAAVAADLLLVSINALDLLLGFPLPRLTRFITLDGEGNLPTWYSSVQWFAVAIVFWMFVVSAWRVGSRRALALFVLPAAFLAFSLDEVAQLHEGLGGILDRVVVAAPRVDTPLPETGVWFVLIGVPFAIAFGVLLIVLKPVLLGSRGAFAKLAVGMAMFLVGAVGAEALSNLVDPASTLGRIEVLIEEGLEMFGSTIVLWSGFELLSGQLRAARLQPPD
jgi:hypothetical protein